PPRSRRHLDSPPSRTVSARRAPRPARGRRRRQWAAWYGWQAGATCVPSRSVRASRGSQGHTERRGDGVNVLVAASGETEHHHLLGAQLAALAQRQQVRDGVRRLQRRDDAFLLAEHLKRGKRLLIGGRDIARAAGGPQVAVLRPD